MRLLLHAEHNVRLLLVARGTIRGLLRSCRASAGLPDGPMSGRRELLIPAASLSMFNTLSRITGS